MGSARNRLARESVALWTIGLDGCAVWTRIQEMPRMKQGHRKNAHVYDTEHLRLYTWPCRIIDCPYLCANCSPHAFLEQVHSELSLRPLRVRIKMTISVNLLLSSFRSFWSPSSRFSFSPRAPLRDARQEQGLPTSVRSHLDIFKLNVLQSLLFTYSDTG